MGILRADLLTHSQLEPSGSVLFDGNSDYLSWSNTNVKVGTSDFTLEAWVNITGNNDATQHQTIFMAGDSSDAGELVLQMIRDTGGGGSALGSGADREIGIRVAGTGYYSGQQITFNQWHHVAVVRDGGAITFFLDGEAGKTHTMTENLTTGFTQIGYRDGSYNGYFKGYISNARIALGAIYKNNFTPSKFELKNVAGTLLLCCQSSTSATTAEVVPSAITANGTAAAASFHPDLKKDITDTGVVFDGFTVLATSTYMVPPSGKTTERNRGRAVWGGGSASPNEQDVIDYLHIQSSGTAIDFGNLSDSRNEVRACGSSTRGVWAGGRSPHPSVTDVMDYIEIASTSNATDFGNLTVARAAVAAVSNQTRGVFMAGFGPSNTNHIDYITIASVGNATDFGDMLGTYQAQGRAMSPTRGLAAGNYGASNLIEYITIATTGNSTDFGDRTVAAYSATGTSDNTRGVFIGGDGTPNTTNVIDFVTIATTGNATDFGDLVTANGSSLAATSNNIIGCSGGGASNTNTIEKITIQTTGNAVDYGDLSVGRSQLGATSDSHGGLS